jgi:hypothetical protein
LNLVGILALASTALVGCGPPWQILHAAEPNPFVNQRTFAVLPIDYIGLEVGEKSEPEYLAEKDAETRQNWTGDKLGMNEEYAKHLIEEANERGIRVTLATGPASAPFIIRPAVRWLEPGFYVGVASGSSEVKMTVQITTPDGKVLDEIQMSHRTGASLVNSATGHRLRSDGAGLGEITAEYLEKRVTGG